jgi:amidase
MKKIKNWYYQSATELVSALANRIVSAAKLLEQSISRIETLDKKINAVIVRDFDRARIAAKAADQAIAKGKQLPLLGLPITVKESFNVAGLPTTWGNPEYKNWRPNEDALTVSRLKSAGAIIMGKTNIPFMLMDWQSYNNVYGTTNNPWNIDLTPGGSSGGSAAALAAGFTSLELGSDFGGSIRVPAHYCGVFGHKPSVNLVPMRGAGPPTSVPSPSLISDFIVGGPMARTAADLALGLKVLAGPDELWDGKAYKLSLPAARHDHLHQFRVLIVKNHPLCPTAAAIDKAMDCLAERLTQLGVAVSHDTRSVPDLAEITRTYCSLFSAFVVGNMPSDEYKRLLEATQILQNDDFSLEACLQRGYTLSYRDWLMKTRTRGILRQQWRNLYKEFDVIICPVMPTPAFPYDHSDPSKRQIKVDNIHAPYSNQYAWVSIATLFGLPTTVTPVGLTENNLPIGVQLIGDYLEDYTTIKLAGLIEDELGGFSEPPLIDFTEDSPYK